MDEDGSIHEAFGTWRMKKNYGKEYMGCARSTFVIGEDGKLIFARYNVKAKGHVPMLTRELGLDSDLNNQRVSCQIMQQLGSHAWLRRIDWAKPTSGPFPT